MTFPGFNNIFFFFVLTIVLVNPSIAQEPHIIPNAPVGDIRPVGVNNPDSNMNFYLFSWDDIPGNDTGRFIRILKIGFHIEWIETAKIEKTDGGKTIKIFTEENSLLLKLNDEKTRVNLTVNDGRTDDFIATMNNGKLNIYKIFTDNTNIVPKQNTPIMSINTIFNVHKAIISENRVQNINKGTNYTTIQAAIDDSSAGDEIQVKSGIYPENVNVNKQLTLRGVSNLTTVIMGNGSGNVMEVTANGVVIDRFRIREGSNGLFVNSSNNVFSNNVIRDMHGVQGEDYVGIGGMASGIYLFDSTNNSVIGNTISNIGGGNGGYRCNGGLSSGFYLSFSINNTISGNTIINITGGSGGMYGGADQEGYGIYLENNSFQNLIYPTNTVDGDPIIYLYDIDGAEIENYVLAANSNPTNLGKIVLINSSNTIIRNNTINNMKGVGGTDSFYGGVNLSGGSSSGIYISGSTNIKITGNTVSNITGGMGGAGVWDNDPYFSRYFGGSGGMSSAIYLYSSSNSTIAGNTITNIIGGEGEMVDSFSGTGGSGGLSSAIYLSDSPTNTLSNNKINYLTGGIGGVAGPAPGSGGSGGSSSGIYLSGSLSSTIAGNTISYLTGGTGGAGASSSMSGGRGGSGGTSSGVYLTGSQNNTVRGNIINNIIGAEGYQESWLGGEGGDSSGIYLSVSPNNTFADNMINNMTGGAGAYGRLYGGSGGGSSGILLSSSPDNAVTGNTISYLWGGSGASSEEWLGSGGNSLGIGLSDSANSNLTGNTISDTTGGGGGEGYYFGPSNGSNGLSAGIYLSTSDNNKLGKNNATSNNDYGIYLLSSSNNMLKGNIANSNSLGIFLNSSNFNNLTSNNISNSTNVGIKIYNTSKNNTISGNKVANSSFGIFFIYAFNTTASNNIMENNSLNFGVGGNLQSHFDGNNIDTSNLANGRPIYYIKYGKNTIYDGSTRASNFYCILCNNVTLKDLEISNMDRGVYFWSTDNSRIQNITVKESGWGLYLRMSSNNTIRNSKFSTSNIRDYYETGVTVSSSNNNTFENNTFISNNYGIELDSSSKNTIYNNYFNNTNNFIFTGTIYGNIWNTTIKPGKNIMGGSYLGGNFWANQSGMGFSQTCPDINGDSICDSTNVLNSINIDHFPLAYPTSINLIRNSGFENGTMDWIFYTSGTGNFTTVSPGYKGSKAAMLSFGSSGTNIQLYQSGVTLEAKTIYRLSFAAYSTTGHNITARLHQHVSPYTDYGLEKSFDLGTSWQTFTTEFTSTINTNIVNDGRFQFWLPEFAAAGDTYYIDDIRLEKIGVDYESPAVIRNKPTGTNVPVSTQINVTFIEMMNRTSVQSSFSTIPATTGNFSWSGNNISYIPGSNLSYNTTYTVTVGTGATDLAGNGLQSPYSWQFGTTPAPATTPPVAVCGADKIKCENVGAPVQFNGSASYDPDGAIVSYYWDFGDGTNTTGAAPKHAYSAYKWNGTGYEPFIANLTVTDNSGLTNKTSQKVVIRMAGDVNGDGKVNILDASVIGLKWGGNDPCADLNNDGGVNILDASIIGLNWGKIP